jgi:4-hydroxy-4-methyl-2-oxoglutarate aldolase
MVFGSGVGVGSSAASIGELSKLISTLQKLQAENSSLKAKREDVSEARDASESREGASVPREINAAEAKEQKTKSKKNRFSKQTQHKSSVQRNPIEKRTPVEAPKDKPEATKKWLTSLLKRLHKVDTAALCDADKAILDRAQSDQTYVGLSLMDSRIKPRNYSGPHKPSPSASGSGNDTKMIGLVKTVQCSRPNDMLAVMRGLSEAKSGEVLVVNTLDSTRAVAGEIFCAEAARKGLGGIVVDGFVRDVGQISKYQNACLMYSSGVTPYAGTVQSVGEIGGNVICGGVRVSSGDIVVGDGDGILVGSVKTFERVIGVAENIVQAERNILQGISQGVSLMKMCNYDEHIKLRKNGKESALEWRKMRPGSSSNSNASVTSRDEV